MEGRKERRILGHPWGNAPGVVANRVALEACVQAHNEGRDLAREGNEIIREASKWSPELAVSCEINFSKIDVSLIRLDYNHIPVVQLAMADDRVLEAFIYNIGSFRSLKFLGGRISINWLETNFNKLPDDATEEMSYVDPKIISCMPLEVLDNRDVGCEGVVDVYVMVEMHELDRRNSIFDTDACIAVDDNIDVGTHVKFDVDARNDCSGGRASSYSSDDDNEKKVYRLAPPDTPLYAPPVVRKNLPCDRHPLPGNRHSP
ncbi:hypothetical protein GOBAR_AA20134 [Gossypium barbadense]|uniref:Ribulose bisphosphate carboxylase large subunit C-terminal domain-containing protein n=1 Tax=Gossypium barbadense TaxID=3634 RepID=A0A2P5XB22_GOSBA|nr:hypothetical protein GOBAR_AA20134 [Gossypium barbadense]